MPVLHVKPLTRAGGAHNLQGFACTGEGNPPFFLINTSPASHVEPIRVILVEDDRELRLNLTATLARQPGLEVIGSYDTAEEALAQADWPLATLLLSDLDLPGLSGVELIRQVKLATPGLIAAAYTIHDDRQYVFDALAAGAVGYLIKGSAPAVLVAELRSLATGGASISPGIAMMLLEKLYGSPAQPQPPQQVADKRLTRREVEMLERLAEGQLYKEISASHHISIHTVHTHIKRIYQKLQATCRSEAVSSARRHGYLS